MAIRINGDNTTAAPGITRGDDTDTGIQFGTDEVSIVTGGTEHVNVNATGDVDLGGLTVSGSAADDSVNIDSSGRLLVGTSSAPGSVGSAPYALLQIEGNTFSGTGPGSIALRSGTASASIGNNGEVGQIAFAGNDNEEFASIKCDADAATGSGDHPGRLVFSTTADGASSPTERMRLNYAGRLYCPGVYTFYSAVGANVYVDSNGNLIRATSSGKYKTDVETIEYDYSSALLNCRPVWFRSISENDNPNWGYWGFIAEEVAEIDPRLVHWKTIEVTYDENGSAVETPCDPEPEGVQYDRFVPHLLNLIKRQQAAIETLEAKVVALEAN